MPVTGGGVSPAAAGSAGAKTSCAKANSAREKRAVRSLIAISPGRALKIGPQELPPCLAGPVARTGSAGALFLDRDKIWAEESELHAIWQAFRDRKPQAGDLNFGKLSRAARTSGRGLTVKRNP